MTIVLFTSIETAMAPQDILCSDRPPIISITSLAVDTETDTELEYFHRKIQFKTFQNNALNHTNYSPEVWKAEALPPLVVAQEFQTFVAKYECVTHENRKQQMYTASVIGGHNARAFTLPVLNNWYKALRVHMGASVRLNFSYMAVFDSIELQRVKQTILEEYQSSRLEALISRYNYRLPSIYRAIDTRPNMMKQYDIRVRLMQWLYFELRGELLEAGKYL